MSETTQRIYDQLREQREEERRAKVRDLEARLRDVTAALRFYAEPRNWANRSQTTDAVKGTWVLIEPAAYEDRGTKARAALQGQQDASGPTATTGETQEQAG